MTKKTAFIFLLLLRLISYSQENLSLNDFINNSKNSLEALNNHKNKTIQEKEALLFAKSFLPNVSLSFTLPGYNHSIVSVAQPNGTYAFRENNNANSSVGLSISQKIPYTGGQISITNSFKRLDLFGATKNITSYSASWFGVSLSQPLNFFNAMKWDKKIQEAEEEYNIIDYKKKNIALKKTTISQYFELLQMHNEQQYLKKEIEITRNYKKVILSLIKAGKAMAYDSIDVELRLLDIQKKSRFSKKSQGLKIKRTNEFFNSKIINSNYTLEVPTLSIKLKELKYYINNYLKIYDVIERNRLLGLEKNIKQLEKNRFYKASLSMGVGFNNSSKSYNNILQNPNRSQNFSISLNVPLLDFGKKRIQLEISKTKYDVETANLEQEKSSTVQHIELLYEEINDLILSLNIEESRIVLLKIKLQRMETLLYAQKILLKAYSETEQELHNSINNRINMIKKGYDKIIEIEEITLLDII